MNIAIKRGKFHYASPDVYMRMFNIYVVSFHGSRLWNILSKDCDRIIAVLNVAVRQAWAVPNILTDTRVKQSLGASILRLSLQVATMPSSRLC